MLRGERAQPLPTWGVSTTYRTVDLLQWEPLDEEYDVVLLQQADGSVRRVPITANRCNAQEPLPWGHAFSGGVLWKPSTPLHFFNQSHESMMPTHWPRL